MLRCWPARLYISTETGWVKHLQVISSKKLEAYMCHVNTTKANWKKEKENEHKRKTFRQPACVTHTSHLLCWCLSLANWKKQLGVSKASLWSSFYCADNINIGQSWAWQWAVVPKGHKRLFTETESEAPHFISGFPIPLSSFPCAPESLSVCPCCGRVQTYRSSLASLEKGGKEALLCSFPDFADGLHHEIWGLCGHHAAELRQWAKITPEAGRKRLAAEEGRKGRKPLEPKKKTPVPTFQVLYLYFLVTYSQVLFFFFFF